MAYYVNQYRQAFPTQFSVPTINTRGQAAVDAYNAGKADYENFAAHDAEMARAGYEASMKRLAAQDAWNAQQNAAVAHNQATNAGVVAIQQEIAQNEAEISKLKTELSQLTAQYGDADAMDRMLAANRARIGDMGNSLAHQQAINNRFQFQWSNKDKVKNQAKALEKDIVDAYREYAYAEDLKSKQVAAYNIKTKLDEYKEVVPEKQFFKYNVTSIVFLSISALCFIGIIVVLLIRPKKTADLETKGDADKKADTKKSK